MNNSFTKNDLIKLLIKKASGFYYSEEQYEYEKTQNKSILNKNHSHNVSFFENIDRGLTTSDISSDNIKSSNETQKEQDNHGLKLSKKKVTTHYISPDINAIKILFEIFEKKVGEENLENLTDAELIELKNKIIKELSNEDSTN